MGTHVRHLPGRIICLGLIHEMRRRGVDIDSWGAVPNCHHGQLNITPDLKHLCFGDDEEVFPDGVPVFSGVTVTQRNGAKWRARLPVGWKPYWTGPIILSHQWNKFGNGRRLLHFLEAVSLLAMHPILGGIRYASQSGTNGLAELYLNPEGMFRVDCGNDKNEWHHAATVEGPSPLRIAEDKVSF
jgi:hypothetical protein